MISLAQITFAGIGALRRGSRSPTEAGFPVWLAILCGAFIAVPFGLVLVARQPAHRRPVPGAADARLRAGDRAVRVDAARVRRTSAPAARSGRPSGSASATGGHVRTRRRGRSSSCALLIVNLKRVDRRARVRVDPLERIGVVHERHQRRPGQDDHVRGERVRRRIRRRALRIDHRHDHGHRSFTVLVGIVWLAIDRDLGRARSSIGALARRPPVRDRARQALGDPHPRAHVRARRVLRALPPVEGCTRSRSAPSRWRSAS